MSVSVPVPVAATETETGAPKKCETEHSEVNFLGKEQKCANTEERSTVSDSFVSSSTFL